MPASYIGEGWADWYKKNFPNGVPAAAAPPPDPAALAVQAQTDLTNKQNKDIQDLQAGVDAAKNQLNPPSPTPATNQIEPPQVPSQSADAGAASTPTVNDPNYGIVVPDIHLPAGADQVDKTRQDTTAPIDALMGLVGQNQPQDAASQLQALRQGRRSLRVPLLVGNASAGSGSFYGGGVTIPNG